MSRLSALIPSEENYFAWGSELLLHRAVLQAVEVFQKRGKGVSKIGQNAGCAWVRLSLPALTTRRRRFASAMPPILNPADPVPYIFMGKIEMVAPNPLACVEQKLARFVPSNPETRSANYFTRWPSGKGRRSRRTRRFCNMWRRCSTKAVTIDAQMR
jgi:hypothetical protein